MPCATTWRQDAPLIQLSSNSADARNALGLQVIHDGPKVCRTVLCVRPDCSDGFFVADLLSHECLCAIWISLMPRAFAAAKAALGVRLHQARFPTICDPGHRLYSFSITASVTCSR